MTTRDTERVIGALLEFKEETKRDLGEIKSELSKLSRAHHLSTGMSKRRATFFTLAISSVVAGVVEATIHYFRTW